MLELWEVCIEYSPHPRSPDKAPGATTSFFLTPFMLTWGLISKILPKKEMTLNTILQKYDYLLFPFQAYREC